MTPGYLFEIPLVPSPVYPRDIFEGEIRRFGDYFAPRVLYFVEPVAVIANVLVK